MIAFYENMTISKNIFKELSMNLYEIESDDIIEGLTSTLEKETGSKIFTIKTLEKKEDSAELELMVVFEDKSILHTFVTVTNVEDKMGLRMRGNFL